MRDGYDAIFDERGGSYHRAMQRLPDARRNEFRAILELVAPVDGHVICDMPSGGEYVRRYLDGADVELISIESSRVFHDFCEDGRTGRRILCPLSDTPLESASIDAVMSLAGLHHIEEKGPIFAEVWRILKPGGRFCLADVGRGSAVDGFLDGFVHEHNSMGHQGIFLDGGTVRELEQLGFRTLVAESRAYPWEFTNADEMACYCKDLFGIDRATSEQVRKGIEEHLGYSEEDGGCLMRWELMFIAAEKPVE